MWYQKDIVHWLCNHLKDEYDIHYCLMQSYHEVPMWWYCSIGIIGFAFLSTSIKIVSAHLLHLGCCHLYPIIHSFCPTCYDSGHHQLRCTYTSNIWAYCWLYSFRKAHCQYIPPHIMFIIATIVSSIWAIFIQDWMLNNINDICTPHQKQGIICPSATTFATSSVIFAAVGPQCLFNPGAS